jgi:hypothetical protein
MAKLKIWGVKVAAVGANAIVVAGLVISIGYEGKLSNCYNSSSFNVQRVVGGLAEFMSDGAVMENCYNTGNITASGNNNGGLVATILYDGGTVTITNSYNFGNITSITESGGLVGSVNAPSGNQQFLNMNNCFNFGDNIITQNNNGVGSILGFSLGNDLLEVNAINVYSKPNAASADNGAASKPNQPIGWRGGEAIFVNAILTANPTLKEDARYTLDYSKSPAFVTELGGAFKYANGRTPKLAWEK